MGMAYSGEFEFIGRDKNFEKNLKKISNFEKKIQKLQELQRLLQ